jgi:hypothetical protein
VAGLLGYVWGDDDNDNDDGWDDVEDTIRDLDDDDWDDFVDRIDEDDFDQAVDRLNDRDWDEVRAGRGRDVNISDSTIVVSNDLKRNQLDAKLKNKREAKTSLNGGQRAKVDLKNGTLQRVGGTRVSAGDRAEQARRAARPQGLVPALAPAKATRERGQTRTAAAERPARDIKLPGAKGRNVDAGATKHPAAAQKRPQRQAAAQQAGQARPQAEAARRPGSQPQAANRAVASGSDRPRDAQRGKQSLAKSGGGGGRKGSGSRGGGRRN